MGNGREELVEKLTHRTIDVLDVAIVVVDVSLRVALYNAAAKRYFGIRDEHSAEATLADLIPQLDEEINGTVWTEQTAKTVIGERRPIAAPRFNLKLADGETNPFDIHASPITDENGLAIGAVLAFYDVRPQMELEEQLLLNAKMTSLSSLASSLAHEIRNPLNTIVMSVQLLAEDLSEERIDRKVVSENLSVLQEAVGRLNTMVKNFLEFAKPLRPRRRFLNINDLITRTLRLYKREAEARRIHVVLQADEVPRVLVDDEQMVRVFDNLLRNAFDALPENGRLDITVRTEGDWVVVDFRDNGKGISEEDMKHIFDLFYSGREDGTGLGLPIVLRILDANQGYVTVHSKEGVGTVFSVHLPTKIAL